MASESVWYALLVRDTQAREAVETCCTTDAGEFLQWQKEWRKEYKREDGYKVYSRQCLNKAAAFLFVGWTD